jgi:hypothetical protein
MTRSSQRIPTRVLVVGAMIIAAVTLAACGSSKSPSTTSTTTTTAAPATSSTTTTTGASSSSLTCASAATLGAAAGTTYTGPTSQPGGNAGTIVCEYQANGSTALLVSLYPSGTSLQTISSTAASYTTPISGLGGSASYYGTEVYVSNSSSPSFSVIDQTGDLTLSQVEAVAQAQLAS